MTAALDRAAFLSTQRGLRPQHSALPACLVLGFDLALAGSAAWLSTAPFASAPWLATPLFTLALLHAYLIHHECVHRAVFARDKYNVALGELLGFALAYPFRARRRSHMLHHAWAGHLERDPTNARARARFATLSARQLHLLDRLWRSWLPFLALNERLGLWRSAFAGDGTRHARGERIYAALALTLYLAMLSMAALSSALRPVLLSYACGLFLLMMLEELVNLPHHIEAPTVAHKLALWEQDEVTHSCRPLPIWSSLVLLNFNLHTAHHLFPGLPWYRLPEAERVLVTHTRAHQGQDHELAISLRLRRRAFADVFASYLAR
jgi:fatty acid desaturase